MLCPQRTFWRVFSAHILKVLMTCRLRDGCIPNVVAIVSSISSCLSAPSDAVTHSSRRCIPIRCASYVPTPVYERSISITGCYSPTPYLVICLSWLGRWPVPFCPCVSLSFWRLACYSLLYCSSICLSGGRVDLLVRQPS